MTKQRKKVKSSTARARQNVKSAVSSLKCNFRSKAIANKRNPSKKRENDKRSTKKSASTEEKPKFSCQICNQLFQFETGLNKHLERHKVPGGFLCSICNERFLTDAERILHKDSVHKIFKCLHCNLRFESEEICKEHVDSSHDGKDRDYFKCSDCGAQFRQRNQLKLHNDSKCGTIRSYSCHQCDSKFISQNTLNAHLMIHIGEKKHLCDFCGKKFLSRGQLQVHERCHTGEKPFKCNVCEKAFSHRESLVTHSSLHTGVKPYVCEACESRFSCIGNLIKHRRARPDTCGLPQYSNNSKCAPRASSKHAGTLTMKTEQTPKRPHGKSKAINVPELLDVREQLVNSDSQSTSEQTHSQIVDVNVVSEEQFNSKLHVIEIAPPQEQIILQDVDDSKITFFEVIVMPDNNVIFSNVNSTSIDCQTLKIGNVFDAHDGVIIDGGEEETEEKSYEIEEIETEHVIEATNDVPIIVNNEIAVLEETLVDESSPNKKQKRVPLRPPRFKCSVCNSEYTSQKRLENHTLCHGANGELIHRCLCCPRFFATAKEMESHKDSEHGVMLTCKLCQKKYKDNDSFNNHMKLVHEKKRKKETAHVCPKCGKCFSSKFAWIEHEKSNCGRSPMYKCDDCEKFYYSAGSLKSHRTIHTGELNFLCNICGKAFRNKGQLKVHARVHSGEKPYKCDQCDKEFAHRESLITHTSTHTGIKRFVCHGCEQRFSCISNLQAHRKSHRTCAMLPIDTRPNLPDATTSN